MKNAILTHLPGDFPWQVQYFDTIDSTNSYAKKLAADGAPHGTVIVAGQQTDGRGRMGRSFSSNRGVGVYLSVILRPNCKATALMHLTCAVAVAACDAIQKVSGFRPQIKWINDLIAQGKKLGGILTELSVDPATGYVNYAVVGIGINCKKQEFPADIKDIAIALESVTNRPICPNALAAALLLLLQEMDGILLTDKARIMAKYKENCITLGQNIYLIQNNTKLP
jgi:BirA family biotin operon repressor/biotin-[acetyl-CoA-carboxylase] ligase